MCRWEFCLYVCVYLSVGMWKESYRMWGYWINIGRTCVVVVVMMICVVRVQDARDQYLMKRGGTMLLRLKIEHHHQ